jgi:tRNA 2-selenouridine synthase
MVEEVDFFGSQTLFSKRAIALIDLRAPVEFLKGSIPTAVNIPLFSDQERSEIGTLYKQVGKSEAVARGIEIFSGKGADFLNQITGLLNSEREVALYCARGGLRSSFVSSLLKAIGIKVFQLRDGYKYFRFQVQTELDLFAEHPKLVLIGMTGAGKTEVLECLKDHPVIDFEKLAGHRGSALGGMAQKFPPATQQNFENLIAISYSKLKKSSVILVEHETSLGDVILPGAIRISLKQEKMVLVTRNFADRVSSIVKVYFSNFTETEFEKFEAGINLFKNQISPAIKKQLIDLARERKFAELTEILLRERYDKTYQKFLSKSEPNIIKILDLSAKFEDSIEWIKRQL